MMTHSLTTEAFADILAGLPPHALSEVDVSPDQTLYALHGANGVRLAVLADRDSAYAAALAHELAPVSVH
jgi:hypothetical protein